MPTPLAPPKPPEPPLFNHDQTRDIKMLGLASLLGGSGLAALRMFKSTPTMDIGGTGTFINIPVPYQAEVRRAGVPKSLAYKRNRLNNVYNFDPLADREVDREEIEKRSYKNENWANPFYAPAMVAAGMIPAWASYHLINNVIKERDTMENKAELSRAKNVFGNAMIAAQADNIRKVPDNSGDPELNGDLDVLADMHSFVKNKRPNMATNSPPAIEKKSNVIGKLLGLDWGRTADNVFKGYMGALGATGLLTAGVGSVTGYRQAKKSDSEAAESEKYLNEYMRRRSLEGTPVHAIPVPITFKKKKKKNGFEIAPIKDLEQKINPDEI